jgi:Polyketide synthase modules and related proteins
MRSVGKKQVEDVGYIEVNGGGSPVVDSIEIKALSDVYHLADQTRRPCFVGSVKPNIGHVLLVSGLAGFIRCVLSVYHKKIPPFLAANEPFEYYDFSASRINFNRETIDWKVEAGKKRIAAQSSFPDGGTNCHIIIEEFAHDERYQQHYFPKAVPDMVKKCFPLHPSLILESVPLLPEESVVERHVGAGMHDFIKTFTQNKNPEVEQENNGNIENFWREVQ